MSEQQAVTVAEKMQEFLKVSGLNSQMRILQMVLQGKLPASYAVDLDKGVLFLVAMVPTTEAALKATGLSLTGDQPPPPNARMPVPMVQLLTPAQSEQVSNAGAQGNLLLMDASSNLTPSDEPGTPSVAGTAQAAGAGTATGDQ